MPALPRLAQAARDAEPEGVADLARLLAASGLSMGIVGSTAPASGTEHAVSHLMEMVLRGRAASHGMQVTVATRLALRVWQLVDRTIRSTPARVQIPDETTCRDAVARAFAELGPHTVDECWTAYSAKRDWLLAHQSAVEALVTDWDAFVGALTLPSPEQFDEVSNASGLPTQARQLGDGYDNELLFWALRNAHLLRERISIVDLADVLGVWSDDAARSIVADAG
jgi:glycerol-1-phosphate dehydrogenase [NAD(P)+]